MFTSLQACRGIACLMVVLFHANYCIFGLAKYFPESPLGDLIRIGPAGIDFFFVLSGFIVMYVHGKDINNPGALPRYLWRRLARAYMFYWLVLVVVVPVYFLVPSFGHAYQRDPWVIVTSIFLIPHPELHMTYAVAWTMLYEVGFFLTFALLLVSRRLGMLVAFVWAGAIVLLLCVPSLVPEAPVLNNFLFNHQFLRFLVGAGVCVALQRWRIPYPRCIAGFGFGLFLIAATVATNGTELGSLTSAFWHTVASALVILGLAEAERSKLLSAPRPLAYLGDASYAIYLVHFPVLSAMAKGSFALHLDAYVPSQVLFLAHVLGALGAGCLAYHVFEYPLHQWQKRFFRSRPATAESQTVTQADEKPNIRKAA